MLLWLEMCDLGLLDTFTRHITTYNRGHGCYNVGKIDITFVNNRAIIDTSHKMPHFIGMQMPGAIRTQVNQVAILGHDLDYGPWSLPLITQFTAGLWGQYNNLVPLMESFVAGPKIVPAYIPGLLFPGMFSSILGGCKQLIPEVLEIFLYWFA